MTTTIPDLDRLLRLPSEDEHLEFKLATTRFDLDELFRYCVAIANEGGGRIVLGVSDALPRQVRGTQAHGNVQELKLQLFNGLHRRVEVEEVEHPDGRVLIVHVPSRPRGVPLEWHGSYLMRVGESLTSMTPDQLRRIMDEAVPDASALEVEGAILSDLDPALVEVFRRDWVRKSGNAALSQLPEEQLLSDA